MMKILQSLYPQAFSSSAEEDEFIRIHHNLVEIRKIIILGFIVYGLFLFLDNFLFPDYFKSVLIIRLIVITPIYVPLFMLTFSRLYYRHSSFILLGLAFASAGGIILIEYITRANSYSEMYFYGIAQVMILFFGTGKISFFPSVICGFGIVVPAIFVDSVYVETDLHRIVTKAIFMITMLFLGLIASVIIQKSARARFVSHKRIEAFSMTDSLTGLKNRHYYQTVIVDEIAEHLNSFSGDAGIRSTDCNSKSSYACIMLDIDHFKSVNDEFGHEIGDQVLKEFSNRILKLRRTGDTLIRWGGEEFLLLLPQLSSESIEILVHRIQDEISGKPFVIGANNRKITVSGGIFMITPDTPDWINNVDDIFNLVDQAMYYSKENGRNRFTQVVFEQSMSGVPVFEIIEEKFSD